MKIIEYTLPGDEIFKEQVFSIYFENGFYIFKTNKKICSKSTDYDFIRKMLDQSITMV